VPDVGLHRAENRRGEILFTVPAEAAGWPGDALAVALGMVVGERAGRAVAVIEGAPASLTEDDLKAFGAVAASAGAVGLFHMVGLTPEASDRATAFAGRAPAETIGLGVADLRHAMARLSTAREGAALGAVALGTPHFSLAEFAKLMPLLAGFSAAPGVALYVNTARHVYEALAERGWLAELEAAGFTVVVDTCTYVTAVMRDFSGVVMTNSGKWAHYAPGNLGVDVAFGSLEACLASAGAGRVVRWQP
jgi:predicted aconitase